MSEDFDREEYKKSLDRMLSDSDDGKFVPGLVAFGAVLDNQTVEFGEYFKRREEVKNWNGRERRQA